ncbi:MAG: hypothetical protein LBL66_04350 [Clostridiales bacterium]|jgi:phosphotriesterase-related protein|nr:hypothetical protein [Clostridiales bacterium]
MAIQTVTGPIKKEEIGAALPHEHLLIDLRALAAGRQKETPSFYDKVGLENRYKVFVDPYALSDNAVMDSEETALKELVALRGDGCETVTDVTTDEIGRNPAALKRLSEASGVKIVMGCGFYVGAAHTDAFKSMTVKEAAARIAEDLNVGAGGTGIRAGVIGEIGTGATVTESEWKAVDAAAEASLAAGRSIHVHTSLYERNGLAVADRLIGRGVNPARVCIDHVDVDLRRDYLLKLLDKGVYIEFDNFGKEFYIPKRGDGVLRGRFAYDLERVKTIGALVRRGFIRQILITNDICLKSMLQSYGGNGYGHIFRNVAPMLLGEGLSAEQVDVLTRGNPADFLDGEGA